MDMIRWLATNKVVLVTWGLGILAMILATLFGGGDKSEHETVAVEAKVIETTAEVTKPVIAATAVAASVVTASDKGEASTEVQAVIANVDTSSSTDVTPSEVLVVEDAVVSSVESEGNKLAEIQESDDLSDKSTDDLLMMAREAYWDNGLDKAASLYSELIVREPTVIEHKGELGNVFWRQGYPKKAAELYAGIAEPMIVKGNGERVSNMVGFIGLFFPERATAIRKLLDTQ